MPQEIRVLQCFSCKIFQVDIVKKSTKWKCRVCNIKQTVRKVFFRGTGTECRIKVQELNMTKGQKHNESINSILEVLEAATDSSCVLTHNGDLNDLTSINVANDRERIPREDSPPKNSCSAFNMFDFSQNKRCFRDAKTEFSIKDQVLHTTEDQKHNREVNSILEEPKGENGGGECKNIKDGDNLYHKSNNFAKDKKHKLLRDDSPATPSNEFNTMFDFSQTKKWTSKPNIDRNAKKSKWDNYV